MSLHVKIEINDDRIGTITVTRTTSHGEQPDSVNFYRWSYWRNGAVANGYVEHRFGDGAIGLAHKVLGEIADRHRIAAECNADGAVWRRP